MKSILAVAAILSSALVSNVVALDFTSSNVKQMNDNSGYILEYSCADRDQSNLGGNAFTRLIQNVANSITNRDAKYLAFSIHNGERLEVGAQNANQQNLFSEVIYTKSNVNGVRTSFANNCSGYFFLTSNQKLHISATESTRRLNKEQIEKALDFVADSVKPLYFLATGSILGVLGNNRLNKSKELSTKAFGLIELLSPDSTNTVTFPLQNGSYNLRSDRFSATFTVRELPKGMLEDNNSSYSKDFVRLLEENQQFQPITLNDTLGAECRSRRQKMRNSGLNHIHDRTYALYATLIKSGASRGQIARCIASNNAMISSYITYRNSPYGKRFIEENLINEAEIDIAKELIGQSEDKELIRAIAKEFARQFKAKGIRNLRQALSVNDDAFADNPILVERVNAFFDEPINVYDNTDDFRIMGINDIREQLPLKDLIVKLRQAKFNKYHCQKVTVDTAALEPDVDNTEFMFLLANQEPKDSEEHNVVVVRLDISSSSKKASSIYFTDSFLSKLLSAVPSCSYNS